MILKDLKEATRQQHEDLEQVVSVMDNTFDRKAYETLLVKFYKFYSSIEPLIAQSDISSHGLDLDARRKLPLLERDLEHLGRLDDAEKLKGTWHDLPTIDNAAKAFGAMYVLEGATLGGQIITRHLKQHMGLSTDAGGAFFNSYGERVGPMWKEFGAAITAFADEADSDDEIVGTAKETFTSFGRCFASELAAVK